MWRFFWFACCEQVWNRLARFLLLLSWLKLLLQLHTIVLAMTEIVFQDWASTVLSTCCQTMVLGFSSSQFCALFSQAFSKAYIKIVRFQTGIEYFTWSSTCSGRPQPSHEHKVSTHPNENFEHHRHFQVSVTTILRLFNPSMNQYASCSNALCFHGMAARNNELLMWEGRR